MDVEGRQPARWRWARAGTWVAFCGTGVVAASWAGRVPAVQERLHLSPGGLALAVLAIEGGALAGLPLGSALVSRWGSRRGLRIGFAVYAPALVLAAVLPSLAWLTAGLALWAVANSVVDMALNAQGVALERRWGRPLLSGLHAAQGIGLLVGALGATAAAAAGIGLVAHFGAVGVVVLCFGLAATVPLVQEPRAEGPAARAGAAGRRRLLPLGAVAFCAFLVDGSATAWIAVHLRTDHGTGAALAAAGYLGFTGAVVLARLVGDRISGRVGRRRIVRICGLLAAAATAVAVTAPTAAVALAGWTGVGLAVALLAPTVLGAAPDVAPARDGTGVPAPAAIATVSSIGYLGSFSGPPLIGALAGVVGLSPALALIGVAGLAAALLAHGIPPVGARSQDRRTA